MAPPNPKGGKLAEYSNVTQPLGAVISSQLATLNELDTVYSVEDMWKLLEVTSVDRYNQSVMVGA